MLFRFLPVIELLKAAGHKYIKRVPVGTTKTGRTRYRYIYRVTHTHRGKHFLDPEHMVENAKFMYHTAEGKEVHAHIKRVVGDRVIYVLDDGPNKGKEVSATKAQLAADLDKEHKYQEQMDARKEKAEQDLEQTLKTGTDTQIARARKEVEKYGGKVDKEQEEPKKEEPKKEEPKKEEPKKEEPKKEEPKKEEPKKEEPKKEESKKEESKKEEPKKEEPKKEEPKNAETLEDVTNRVLAALYDNPDLLKNTAIQELIGGKAELSKPQRNTEMFLTGKDGSLQTLDAEYKLVEADDLIASHIAGSFGVNPKYPKDVQERSYHTDKSEQMKVLRNAKNFKPALAINTNPDAINGPPIMTPEGVILGGNSRTMSIQHAYDKHEDRADVMRDYLSLHASTFGFKQSDVQKLKKPVLVRVHKPKDTSKSNLQLLVRQMNESQTQEMSQRVQSRATAKRLSDKSLRSMAEVLSNFPDKTLNELLSKPSRSSRSIISALRRDGIITPQNENRLIRSNGALSREALQMVSDTLLGKVVSDIDVIQNMPPQLANNLTTALPSLLRAGMNDKLREGLETAVNAYHEAIELNAFGAKDKPENALASIQEMYFDQKSLTGDTDKTKDAVRKNPLASHFLTMLVTNQGPRRLAVAFKRVAEKLEGDGGGLFGPSEPMSATEAVEDALQDQVKLKQIKEVKLFKGLRFRYLDIIKNIQPTEGAK